MTVWVGPNRTPVGLFGQVLGLTHESTLPGGDRSCSFSLRLRSTQDVPLLEQGQRCGISLGGVDLWTGRLIEPEPSGPDLRTFSAEGSAVELADYIALTTTPTTPYTLTGASGVMAVAQARGLSITSGTLVNAPYGMTVPNDGTRKIDQAVNEIADLNGITWQVNSGRLDMFAYPSTPTVTIVARDQGSRSMSDFITDLRVVYTASGGVTGTFVSSTQQSRRGRREELLDLTDRGTLTLAQATAIGQAELARRGVRTRFSSPLLVEPGDLLTRAGVPIDPRVLRAGVVAEIAGLDVARGGEADGTYPKILLGSVQVDHDRKSATVTPFEFTGASLQAALKGGFLAQ